MYNKEMFASFINNFLRFLLVSLESLLIFSSKRKKGVLIVRLDAIGDFFIWTHSANEYRRLFPDQKITLIANKIWKDLALQMPYWDEVLEIDTNLFSKNVFYRWSLLFKINKASFQIAIQPTFSRLFLHGDSIIRASNAKQRLGSVGDLSRITNFEKSISNRWYTKLFPASPHPIMELERNAEFLSHLMEGKYSPNINILPHVTELPEKLRTSKEYFIIFPGASWHGRQWPIKHYALVIEHLFIKFGWQSIICGSSSEKDLCQAVSNEANADTINFAGETTLPELLELIRGAKLLISNETSAIHIAAATGTPTVCILGGGHYGRFMPYPDFVSGIKPLAAVHMMPCFNCNWKCNLPHDPSQAVPCIGGISVTSVVNLATQVIELKK